MCDCAMCEATNGRACANVCRCGAPVDNATGECGACHAALRAMQVTPPACDPRVALADCPRCQAEAADDERAYNALADAMLAASEYTADDAAEYDDYSRLPQMRRALGR